jgi:ribosomal protein S18 acetylase RimI-like enzyme
MLISRLPHHLVASEEWRNVGKLLRQAVPYFYDFLPVERAVLEGELAKQIGSKGSEVEETYGAIDENEVVGVVALYDATELAARQLHTTVELSRVVDASSKRLFVQTLRSYASSVEPLRPSSGKYISRVAVHEASRGRGVGASLVRHVIALYPHEPLVLHVARQNVAATALYDSLGFKHGSKGPYPVSVMIREA